MKNLENLKFEFGAVLDRSQLKTILGGGDPMNDNLIDPSGDQGGGAGSSNECYCKNSTTGGARYNTIDNCNNCESWCDQNYSGWTSWICSGPLGGGSYGY